MKLNATTTAAKITNKYIILNGTNLDVKYHKTNINTAATIENTEKLKSKSKTLVPVLLYTICNPNVNNPINTIGCNPLRTAIKLIFPMIKINKKNPKNPNKK